MKKKAVGLFLALFVGLFMSGCDSIRSLLGTDLDEDSSESFNSIEGFAYLKNQTDHAGIAIAVEQTQGTGAVLSNSKAVFGDATTSSDGFYVIGGVAPGIYTVFAAYQNSREKTVAATIIVEAETNAVAEDLFLT